MPHSALLSWLLLLLLCGARGCACHGGGGRHLRLSVQPNDTQISNDPGLDPAVTDFELDDPRVVGPSLPACLLCASERQQQRCILPKRRCYATCMLTASSMPTFILRLCLPRACRRARRWAGSRRVST